LSYANDDVFLNQKYMPYANDDVFNILSTCLILVLIY